MMSKLIPLFFVLVGGAGAFACGSDDNSGNTGAACVPKEYQAQATPACVSCVESQCNAQYKALCDANCNSGAGGNGQVSNACLTALQAVGECGDQHCPVCSDQASGGSAGASAMNPPSGAGKACTVGGQICNWFASSTPASSVQSVCDQSGGTLSDHCATAGLSGCCATASGTLCYYFPEGSAVDSIQSACTQSGGTWGTTPP